MPLELAHDLATLALYDIVIFADDSGSMVFEEGGERINDLKVIMGRVAEVATLFDEDGELHIWSCVCVCVFVAILCALLAVYCTVLQQWSFLESPNQPPVWLRTPGRCGFLTFSLYSLPIIWRETKIIASQLCLVFLSFCITVTSCSTGQL